MPTPRTCIHPDCDRHLRPGARAELCMLHAHTPNLCRCMPCRKRDARAAAEAEAAARAEARRAARHDRFGPVTTVRVKNLQTDWASHRQGDTITMPALPEGW